DGGGLVLSRMADDARSEGYSLVVRAGSMQVNLVKRWLDDAIRVEADCRGSPDAWHHVMFTYDGTRLADGIHSYRDGIEQKLKVHLDDLNQSFQTRAPLRIGGGGGPEGRFVGLIDDVRIYGKALPADGVALLSETTPLASLATTAVAERTELQ